LSWNAVTTEIAQNQGRYRRDPVICLVAQGKIDRRDAANEPAGQIT
jgi:hypothetical protein